MTTLTVTRRDKPETEQLRRELAFHQTRLATIDGQISIAKRPRSRDEIIGDRAAALLEGREQASSKPLTELLMDRAAEERAISVIRDRLNDAEEEEAVEICQSKTVKAEDQRTARGISQAIAALFDALRERKEFENALTSLGISFGAHIRTLNLLESTRTDLEIVQEEVALYVRGTK